MKTVTLKLDGQHIAILKQRAKALGRSQGAIVRDLIEQRLAPQKKASLYQQAKDLCGTVRAPKDLSTRPLTGYGGD